MALNFQGGRLILGTEFAGYTIDIFEPGTTTDKTTYKDSALTGGNENTAPITLDSLGAAQIWYDGNADWVFYDTNGATVYSDDNINLSSSSTATGASNLILNPSFEDDTDGDGVPDSWTVTLYSGGAGAVDTTSQYNGQTSYKFTSTGTGGGYLTSTSFFAVSPSVIYSVGFALISSAADVRNTVDILWYKADQTASATASSAIYDDSTTNPTSWTEKFYEVTAPSDAYYAKIRLTGCHSSDATAGNTRFDNVTVSEYFHKRALNSLTRTLLMAQGASLAASASTDIWAAGDGNTIHLTGTATETITSWGTAARAGAWMAAIVDNPLVLAYDGTSNDINSGGVNYTLAAGDQVNVYARGTTSFKVLVNPYSGRSVTAGTATVAANAIAHNSFYIQHGTTTLAVTTSSGVSTNVDVALSTITAVSHISIGCDQIKVSVVGLDENQLKWFGGSSEWVSGVFPSAPSSGNVRFSFFNNTGTTTSCVTYYSIYGS